jgi:hypothetical protein
MSLTLICEILRKSLHPAGPLRVAAAIFSGAGPPNNLPAFRSCCAVRQAVWPTERHPPSLAAARHGQAPPYGMVRLSAADCALRPAPRPWQLSAPLSATPPTNSCESARKGCGGTLHRPRSGKRSALKGQAEHSRRSRMRLWRRNPRPDQRDSAPKALRPSLELVTKPPDWTCGTAALGCVDPDTSGSHIPCAWSPGVQPGV